MKPTKEERKHAAEVVSMGTYIQRSVIHYDVRIGDDMTPVWERTVYFGATDATVAGGAAFREAARDQQRIADEWAAIGRAEDADG